MRPEHRRTIIEAQQPEIDEAVVDKEELHSYLSNLELQDETRNKVIELQEKKSHVMEWLKEQRVKLNNSEKIELFQRNSKSFYVAFKDGIFIASDGEESFNITLGELLTDVSWGIDYDLDVNSVPVDVAKQYILSRAKKALRELLDRQLVLIELDINNDEKQKKSFQAVEKRQRQGLEVISQDQGFIAEEMTLNLMKKLIIDYNLPIDIEEADIYDDVVNKVDYVITRNDHNRGVEVDVIDQENEGIEQIGIQFTLMFRKASMTGKKKTVTEALRRGIIGELQNLNDIALVNVHPAYIKRSVNKWKKTKAPGGPDSCLETAAKVDLVQKILKDLFSEDEIDKIISEVYNTDREKIKIRKTY